MFCLGLFELAGEGCDVGLGASALVFVVIEGFSGLGNLKFEGFEDAGGGGWVGVGLVGMVGCAADGAGVSIGQGGAEGGGFVSGGGGCSLMRGFCDGEFVLCGGDGGGLKLFEDGLAFGAALLEVLAGGESGGVGGLSAGELSECGERAHEVLLFGVMRGERL